MALSTISGTTGITDATITSAKLADFAALGLLNKFLGGLFGLLKMTVIIGVLITLFALINSNLMLIEEKRFPFPFFPFSTKLYYLWLQ